MHTFPCSQYNAKISQTLPQRLLGSTGHFDSSFLPLLFGPTFKRDVVAVRITWKLTAHVHRHRQGGEGSLTSAADLPDASNNIVACVVSIVESQQSG